MFKEMLKHQSTIAHSVEDCEKYSPFRMWHNPKSDRWVVSRKVEEGMSCVAAGLNQEEATACLMVKANQYILQRI